ncbi:hypothetical protein LCGC14_2925740, partial [marine sediment metagenome]
MADTKCVLAVVAAIASLAGAAPAAPRDTAGLHIPNTKRVNFTWQTNDGAGYRWDVQYYGSIGNGTNNAYAGGMYCQVWGSNVTGREATDVSYVSQVYCDNIVGGWSLAKAGQTIPVPAARDIPVFGQFDELIHKLPHDQKPNKVIVYSPPDAVYGDVKEVVEHGKRCVETIFVITEHVSVEVTAKLRRLCDIEGVDIIGCNTLGMINVHEKVRIGA